MTEIFKVILAGLIVVTSVSCATGLQELSSETTETTKDKPIISNPNPVQNPMRYGNFESFSTKSSSENYRLTSTGTKLFSQGKLSSEQYQWEDPVLSLTEAGQ